MATKTKFEVGYKFTQEYNKCEVINISDNKTYVLLKCLNINGGRFWWWCSNVTKDDEVSLCNALGENQYNEAYMTEFFNDQCRQMEANKIAKVEREAREKKLQQIGEDIHSKLAVAQKMRSEAITELNLIVCSAKDFQAVQKNKRATELLNLITLVDTYSKLRFFPTID